ncbi:MAG: hypothetical protein KF861_10235, partial [Planctomycetaceae bacterium]|nr:hypothetical protein [Planctomycetaceae bacterium]
GIVAIVCIPAALWNSTRANDALPMPAIGGSVDRSPVDIALSPDGRWLVTANESSDSVSLIRTRDGAVVDEIACGRHPAKVTFCPDGQTVLATAVWSGEVIVLAIADERLQRIGAIQVGYEPWGVAVAPDGRRAFVGLVATGQVAEIDLARLSVLRRIDVGRWPRYLTVTLDGTRLAVGCAGDGKIVVVDAALGEPLYEEPLANGINLGHMVASTEGDYVYFPWMVYRTNPITAENIRRGWVLASRIGRVRLDGPSDREAISLDVPRKAVADPHGLAISQDGNTLVASASGTHELLVYRLPDLPFVGAGGPGDLIDRALERDRERFDRIEVGGRPMGLQMAADNRTVYVANYLHNAVQVVDLAEKRVIQEIALGGPEEPSQERQGMALFYDGRRSLDQWYSCHSCHQDGGGNSRPMDTFNDGSPMTLKTVLPLYHVAETSPWTWHGWQTDLHDAMHTSFTSTMLGEAPTSEETEAITAFLTTLEAPPNPFREADGSLSAAAERGRLVFESRKAACTLCHSGPYFTDGQIHDVGLGSPADVYEGFNTPTLLGVHRKVRLLHAGRTRSLEQLLTDLHSPAKVSGTETLTDEEVQDLIAYLKSL